MRPPSDHDLSGTATLAIGADPPYLTNRPELFYSTGKPCVRGHRAPRYRSNQHCTACLREACRGRDPWRERLRGLGYQANRSARRYGITERVTAEDILAIFERDGWRCLSCGATEKLTADHVVPLALGGTNTVGNLQTLCLRHNQRKHLKVTDYRQSKRERRDDDNPHMPSMRSGIHAVPR